MDATHNSRIYFHVVYRPMLGYQDIMDLDLEGIIQHAAKAIHGDGPVDYQGTEIKINNELTQACPQMIMEIAGADFWQSFEEA